MTWGSCKPKNNDELPSRYNVSFQALCNDSIEEKLHLYTLKPFDCIPYNRKYTNTKDSIKFSFEFVDMCCKKFTGTTMSRNDTLVITYFETLRQSLCPCWCDYRLSYTFEKKERLWNHIQFIKK
jgi:hypothetical protein